MFVQAITGYVLATYLDIEDRFEIDVPHLSGRYCKSW